MKFYDFLVDPQLGGLGAESYRTWHIVARLLDGDARLLSADDLAVAQQITSRTRFPKQPVREFYAGIGRRSGKTTFCAKLGTYLLSHDYTSKLTAGEVATVACLAPTVDQSSILFKRMEATITASPLLTAQVDRITANAVEFCHRTSLEVAAASFRSTRGPTYAGVILDEAAYLRSEDSATPDVEIIRAVRPGLATLNGWLIVLSSPYMRRGALWNAYRKHFGNNDSPCLYIEGPTSLFNPVLDGGVIASAYEDDPEAAAAEWGGQFRNDLSAAFDPAWIDNAVDTGVFERACVAALPEGRAPIYFAFTDPSGGSGRDSWSTRISHVEGVAVIDDALLEIRPPFNTADAARQVAEFLKSYGISYVTGDRYAGSWPADALLAHGIGYIPSERSKSEIYRECVPLFSSGRVHLLDHSRTINQLRMLERRVRSGGDNFDHPTNGNDDNSNALCGALLLASRGTTNTKDQQVEFGRSQVSAAMALMESPINYEPPRRVSLFDPDTNHYDRNVF